MELYGTCQYCGQMAAVEANEDATQGELDAIASDKCMCPEAQSDRRKKERKKKIDSFVNKHFCDELATIIHYLIKVVEEQNIEDAVLKLPDGKSVKIWLDGDRYLRIKVKKTEDEELKA